jgi:hypothetical protein
MSSARRAKKKQTTASHLPPSAGGPARAPAGPVGLLAQALNLATIVEQEAYLAGQITGKRIRQQLAK